MKTLSSLMFAVALLGGCTSTAALSDAAPLSDQEKVKARGAVVAGAHFHHVHLNVTDRAASIAYYLKHFSGRAEKFAGTEDAVWVQRSWLLFNEVAERPPSSAGTAINHIGWGTPDAHKEFARQKELGATFHTEIRDIGKAIGGRTADAFSFMYLTGPDGELIELNTDEDDNFAHVNFNSRQPLVAGSWFANMFGLTESLPVLPTQAASPTADRLSRRHFDNVNTIFAGAPEGEIRSTAGTVIDHIAVSVPNLEAALAAIAPYNTPVLAGPKAGGPGWSHAFIEGPDKLVIELIEDRTAKPKITG